LTQGRIIGDYLYDNKKISTIGSYFS